MFGTEKDPNLDCSPQKYQHADISDCDASCDASGLCLQSSNNSTVVQSTCSRSASYLTGTSTPALCKNSLALDEPSTLQRP